MENENKNEIISSELEENSPSSANFEFNNLIPGFANSGMPNSGSIGCELTNLIDLEFSGSVLGSDSAGILPGAISIWFKNVSPKLKIFLINTVSARCRDVLPGAMSSGYNDVLPGAMRFRFQEVLPGASSSGSRFQDVSPGAKSSGFKDVLPGAKSSGFKDVSSDAISFGSQDVLFGAVSFGSQDVSFSVVRNFFNNWNAVQCAVDNYSKKHGFVAAKFRKDLDADISVHRDGASSKTNCLWLVRFYLEKCTNLITITSIVDEHYHECDLRTIDLAPKNLRFSQLILDKIEN
ncbi:27384_t:CDS:2 [Gigaspora margarita]|uniref:27384_t:CDS:1 n=1 Tax=Gigaspora margarita TaxID=4874 RepID=A0ABN7VHN3_GIGMA|nr:27384_t:CDS:2 [Gigaspora margarita]